MLPAIKTVLVSCSKCTFLEALVVSSFTVLNKLLVRDRKNANYLTAMIQENCCCVALLVFERTFSRADCASKQNEFQ